MKPFRSRFFPCLGLSVSSFVFVVSGALRADVIYWDGSVNTSWSTLGNWSTSGAAGTPDPAAVPGAGDTATFGITGLVYPHTVTLDGSQAVAEIATEEMTGLLTLRGGGITPQTLTIGTGGINHLRGGLSIGSAAEDKVNILLAGSQTWNSASGGAGTLQAIRIHNDVSASSAGNTTLTLDGFNTGTLINGVISDGAGTVSVVKNGIGAWELQGVNTYTGTTQINAGTLRLTMPQSGSAFTVAGGATLALKTANGNGTLGFSSAQLTSFLATTTFSGPTAALGLDTGNGGFTYDGNLSGNFTLTKQGNNTLTLSGTNTHTGTTNISQGNIAYMNPAAVAPGSAITVGAGSYLIAYSGAAGFTELQMDALRASATFVDNTAAFGINTANGDLTYSTALSGAFGFAKAGANTLTFSGTASNTYTGPTYAAGGTLLLSKTGGATAVAGDLRVSTGTLRLTVDNQIADTSAASVSGGTLDFGGRAETIASLAITSTGSAQTGTGTATVNVGAITRSGTTSKLTINSGARMVATSVALTGDNIALAAANGGNILIGGGNTSQTTELTIGSGGLSMTGQTIQVNVAGGTQKGTVINLGGDFTGSGANLIAVSGVTSAPAILAMGAGTRTFTVTNNVTDIGLTMTGEVLAKAGSGTLALSGSNTYTGVTKVDAGILRVRHNNALGTTAGGTEVAANSTLQLDNNVTVTGETLKITGAPTNSANTIGLQNLSGDNAWTGDITLDVSGAQNTRVSLTAGTMDLRGKVIIDSGASTATTFGLVLTGNAGVGKISGVISGVGTSQNVIKNGANTWELSGTNTYAGVTRVDDGILIVSSIANNLGNPITTGNRIINLGESSTTGTLQYTGLGETTNRGVVLRASAGGGGVIEQAGTGALLITGDVSGNTSTTDKTLTLQGSTAGTGELSGAFSDTVGASKTSVLKTGTGMWTLSGTAKAYEGTTTVTGGTLSVSTSLTQSSSISVAGGTFVIAANNVIKDDAQVNLGEGAILKVANFTDVAGVMAVTGNAQLQLLGGGNHLTFADSSTANWIGGTLAITGWAGLIVGGDEIYFSSDSMLFAENAGGLTSSQLSAITFINPAGFNPGVYSSKLDGTLLLPDQLIPEPTSILTFLVGGAGLLLRRRRA